MVHIRVDEKVEAKAAKTLESRAYAAFACAGVEAVQLGFRMNQLQPLR